MKNKNTVNPKSLKGNDKLDRIKDLMSKMGTINESTSRSELEFIKKGADNIIYGIVRENHTYFIKTTDKKSVKAVSETADKLPYDRLLLSNEFSGCGRLP